MSEPIDNPNPGPEQESATIGGGCFWCLEAIFKRRPGVLHVESGYAGGQIEDPTYQQVCAGTTGHAEVIRLTYDPKIISYQEILNLFWQAHDPTTLNRQGADSGSQYRSIILTHNGAQQEVANASRDNAASQFNDPIVTEIVPLEVFYPAEGHHQDYYDQNPDAGYCGYVIRPKIEKLEQKGILRPTS